MVMHDYAPRFVASALFDRRWKLLRLDDDDSRALEVAIQADPDGPPLVRGAGGLRKIRFAPPGSHRGKSGSFRVGYAHFPEPGIVLLLQVWAKSEKADLSQSECHAVSVALT